MIFTTPTYWTSRNIKCAFMNAIIFFSPHLVSLISAHDAKKVIFLLWFCQKLNGLTSSERILLVRIQKVSVLIAADFFYYYRYYWLSLPSVSLSLHKRMNSMRLTVRAATQTHTEHLRIYISTKRCDSAIVSAFIFLHVTVEWAAADVTLLSINPAAAFVMIELFSCN